MFTCYFRFNLHMVLLSMYISFWFVPHWTLDCSFVFKWRCYLGSERIPRLCLMDSTCIPYSLGYWKCTIITIGLHWAAIVKIISSCLVSNCYPVSYEMLVLWLLLWLIKGIKYCLVGRVNGPHIVCMSLVFTDSSHWYHMCITCNNHEYAPV